MPFRRDLGLQLLALYLLFVGPVILAALVFDAFAGSRLRRDVQAADLALARSIALETDASLRNALRTVARLSLAPEVTAMGGSPRRELPDAAGEAAPSQPAEGLQDLASLFASVATARGEINLVYVLDANGIMLYHYPEGPGSTVGVDFSFRPYFKAALSAGGPLMSEGRVSPTTGKPVVTAVMPVRDRGGSFLGLVATNLDLQQLSATLAQIATDPDSELRVSIVDASGQIVADSDPGRLLTSARDEFPSESEAALGGQSASQISRESGDREWLRSYVPIPSAHWAVVVQRPSGLAFASPIAFHNGLLVAIGIFLVGGFFFWMMLSRRVIAPLERLAAFSAAISQRSVAPADRARLAQHASRLDQMGHLIRALTQMECDIERRFTELSTLLDTSTAVVSSLDLQRVLDTILEQVQRLLGVDMCAIIALDERAGELRLRASRGLSEDYLHRIRARSIHSRPVFPSVRAILDRQIVQVADIETVSDFPPAMRERARTEGYRALTAAPLFARHTPPAALIVYWRSPHPCSPEELNLIVTFANQAAMAIENASLFALTDEKLREQTRTLEALVQSLSDGLILASPDDRILYCNRRIGELAAVSPDEIQRHTAATLYDMLLSRSVQPNADRAANEISICDNGRTLDLRLQSFDVTDERGHLIGRGQIWHDVTGDKELDRMKSALIATVSHELRTPLAIIKGNITSLLARDVSWDSQSQREFLEAASLETDRLSTLVTDLLDLSKIQAGTFVVNPQPCSLPPLVARAAARVRPAPGARLITSFAPGLPVFQADAARIEAVLRNLIENAARYSPPGSPIRVEAGRVDGHILVRVIDEGPGIPPDDREKIFDRFYQIDTGLARQKSGAGLGLAICKGFVEAHQGKIWVEPGRGETVFAFTLPL